MFRVRSAARNIFRQRKAGRGAVRPPITARSHPPGATSPCSAATALNPQPTTMIREPVTDIAFPDSAFDPAVNAAVAQMLSEVWDPDGRIIERMRSADGDEPLVGPEAYDGVARTVCGVLAGGGNLANVAGYLGGQEERLFGAPVTTGRERWGAGRSAAAAMGLVFRKRRPTTDAEIDAEDES